VDNRKTPHKFYPIASPYPQFAACQNRSMEVGVFPAEEQHFLFTTQSDNQFYFIYDHGNVVSLLSGRVNPIFVIFRDHYFID